ncbi:MAG: Tol-Pal system protein TolB [Piscirickettsiaceae bacterium]|nr:Tol-Pal system protein TolB [Piscirickettsiaceae bacterium]
MGKQCLIVICLVIVSLPWQAQAVLTIEITGGAEAALPIAIVPFGHEGFKSDQDISKIICDDLAHSGRFIPLPIDDLISSPHEESEVNFRDWRLLRSESLLVGKISSIDGRTYQVQFQLFDVYKNEQLVGRRYQVSASGLRRLAHQISDLVYETLIGEAGIFSTSLVFVTDMKPSDGENIYTLRISDADGTNKRSALRSKQPILSPSWSPDGQRLSYVSFERGKAEVFILELRSGLIHLVAAFKGMNSAPAWSPDGQKLALMLSKDGNPEIYILELAADGKGKLVRITHNIQVIDSEPAWMPNGHEIIFTSDRGGQPQIYRISTDGGSANRLTFEGYYNASPDISPDGRNMTMIHSVNGRFHIAVQDLKTGTVQVLTDGGTYESPIFAPNGRIIIYATEHNGRAVLEKVSVDGRIHQRLKKLGSNVREPEWSPIRR